MADLSGPLAKLRRADGHRQSFDALAQRLVDDGTHTIAIHYDAESGWNEARWVISGEVPEEEFALIFGDVLGNLRASLDSLVWQLVIANGEEPGLRNQFPVAKTEKEWVRAMERGWLCGVADKWVQEIKSLQPYHRTDRPEIHPLAIIDFVNNLNKHRFLPITVLTPHIWKPVLDVRDLKAGEQIQFDGSGLDRPVEDGAPLVRWRAESGVEVKVLENPQPSVRISFRDGLDHAWLTVEVIEWVRGTLSRFEPAFTS